MAPVETRCSASSLPVLTNLLNEPLIWALAFTEINKITNKTNLERFFIIEFLQFEYELPALTNLYWLIKPSLHLC